MEVDNRENEAYVRSESNKLYSYKANLSACSTANALSLLRISYVGEEWKNLLFNRRTPINSGSVIYKI
jgi:hypothetical protein